VEVWVPQSLGSLHIHVILKHDFVFLFSSFYFLVFLVNVQPIVTPNICLVIDYMDDNIRQYVVNLKYVKPAISFECDPNPTKVCFQHYLDSSWPFARVPLQYVLHESDGLVASIGHQRSEASGDALGQAEVQRSSQAVALWPV